MYKNVIKQQNFTLRILDEAFLENQIVLYFSKNFYLVGEFNDKISRFKANGLLSYWMSKYISKDNKFKTPPSGLNLNQLEGEFIVLLYGLAFSSIVFILELTVHFTLRVGMRLWRYKDILCVFFY